MEFPIARILFAPIKHRYRSEALGEADKETRTIWIDPRGQNVAHTLLHELLHIRHPGWSETRVKKETARRWRRLTWLEKAALYRQLGRAQIEETE